MITTLKHTLKLGLAVASVSLLGSTAEATLLSSAYETQLESWLGEGDQDFTNVYTFATGDAAGDFHNAADNKGATFTLLKVMAEGIEQVIGGYNPQSWDATINDYVYTDAAVNRTAFLFNLTDVVKLTQNSGSTGREQVYSANYFGPTFGGGNDLLNYDTETFGVIGHAREYSYGQGTNVFGIGGGIDSIFTITEFKVYTIATASTGGGGSAVPDASSTFGLFGLALLGLVGVRARMKRV